MNYPRLKSQASGSEAPKKEHGQQNALQHPVRDAAGRLISGQAFREGRVQHREAGTEAVGLRAVFLQRLLVGDDGIQGAFAAGGGNGQDGAHGQSLLRHLPGEKVPEIAVIGYADGDGLGSLHHSGGVWLF